MATAEQENAEATLREATPALQQAQDTWFALSALAERMRGTIALAGERARNLAAPARDAPPGGIPDELEAAAARAEAEQEALQETVEAAADELTAATAERIECERALRAAEAELVAANRLIADRREGLARLAGQVHAARSRLSAGDDEVTRLAGAVADARDRAAAADSRLRRRPGFGRRPRFLRGRVWTRRTRRRPPRRPRRRPAPTELTDALRTAQTERLDPAGQGGGARPSAWTGGTAPRRCSPPATSCPACSAGSPTRWTSPPAIETAIAAALGAIAEAVAVSTVPDAVQALELLREQRQWPRRRAVQGPRQLPGSTRLAGAAGRSALGGRSADRPEALLPALARALDRVAVVPDMASAVDVRRSTSRTSGRSPSTAT